MRVELEADDFHLVTLERVQSLAVVGVPDLGGSVEGARHYFVSVRLGEESYP